MFSNLVATLIGLIVVVLSGTFVTIINPVVGIPFILCGIFLLLFPNLLSNSVLRSSKNASDEDDADVAEPHVPRIETYKLSDVALHRNDLEAIGEANPDYLLD